MRAMTMTTPLCDDLKVKLYAPIPVCPNPAVAWVRMLFERWTNALINAPRGNCPFSGQDPIRELGCGCERCRAWRTVVAWNERYRLAVSLVYDQRP